MSIASVAQQIDTASSRTSGQAAFNDIANQTICGAAVRDIGFVQHEVDQLLLSADFTNSNMAKPSMSPPLFATSLQKAHFLLLLDAELALA